MIVEVELEDLRPRISDLQLVCIRNVVLKLDDVDGLVRRQLVRLGTGQLSDRAHRGHVAGEIGGLAAVGPDPADNPSGFVAGGLRRSIVVLNRDVIQRHPRQRSLEVGEAHDATGYRSGDQAGIGVVGDLAAVALLAHDAAGRLLGGLDGAGVPVAGDLAPREAHDAARDVVLGGDGAGVGAARDLEVGGAVGRVAVGAAHDAAGNLAVRRDGRSVRAAVDFVFRAEHAAHDAARGLEGGHGVTGYGHAGDGAAVHEADRGAGVVACGFDADVCEPEVLDRAALDHAEQAGAHGVAVVVGVSRGEVHAQAGDRVVLAVEGAFEGLRARSEFVAVAATGPDGGPLPAQLDIGTKLDDHALKA